MKRLLCAGACLAATALAGCAGGGSTSAPGVSCSLPAGVTNPSLVKPGNGSTVAAASVQTIYMSTQGGSLAGLSPAWNLIVAEGNAAIAYGSALSPVAAPPPGITPSASTTFYEASSFPTAFLAGQTVTVFINSATSCNPAPIGTFTTT